MVVGSKWGMYCILVNALVGAGILTLPKAFQAGGLLVSFVCLLIIALVNWLIHRELLEITEELSLSNSSDQHLLDEDRLLKSPYQWELPEIVRQIMGPMAYAFYFFFFAAYVVTQVATYISLFGQAMCGIFGYNFASEMPDKCGYVYPIGMFVFTAGICVLATLDYMKQMWAHRAMAAAQFLFTVLIVIFSFTQKSNPHYSLYNPGTSFSDFLYTVKVIVFACAYQICIPSVLAASAKHHTSQIQVAYWMFVSAMVMYGTVGCVAGMLLNLDQSNISLSFKPSSELPSTLISVIIGIPAIDLIFNSPIYSQSLSSSVFTALYGPDHKSGRTLYPWAHLLLRVGCVLPSLLVAFLIQVEVVSYEKVAQVCGSCVVMVIMIFIPLCYNLRRPSTKTLNLRVKLSGLTFINYAIAGMSALLFLAVVLEGQFSS